MPVRLLAHRVLISTRPDQWTKNLIIFAGLIFGHQLFVPAAVGRAVAAFAIFCALSGGIYLVNDVVDRQSDRRHPVKGRRPIAAGELSRATALTMAAVLFGAALSAAFVLRPAFGVVAVGYAVLLGCYTALLKHVVILDVLTIAVGFVLRAAAGALAVDVPISQWLLICTILLALFLALSKRRHEVVLLADEAARHRPALGEYTPYLLDQMISVVTASTLMAYAFYTVSPETVEKFGSTSLDLTIPFPLYGIFRYLYLVHRRRGGGSPSEMLLTDLPLLLCVGGWAVALVLIIYRPFGG